MTRAEIGDALTPAGVRDLREHLENRNAQIERLLALAYRNEVRIKELEEQQVTRRF